MALWPPLPPKDGRGERPCLGVWWHAAWPLFPRVVWVYYNREARGERPMAESTVEQRLTAVENALRELQEAMKARNPAPDWLDRVIGSIKDEPAFDEVLAYGRAIRQADRPTDDQCHSTRRCVNEPRYPCPSDRRDGRRPA